MTYLVVAVVLSWFVNYDEVEKALKERQRIEEHHVQCHPDLVPSASIDDVVDVKTVRKFFTPDAWRAVENVLKAKAKCKIFTCGICFNKLGKQSVCCDSCLKWFDFKCVALKAAPKVVHWYCRGCRSLCSSQ